MNIHKSWLFSFWDFYPRCWLLAHTSFRRTKFRTISAYYHHSTETKRRQTCPKVFLSINYNTVRNLPVSSNQQATQQANCHDFFPLEPKTGNLWLKIWSYGNAMPVATTPIRLRSFDFHFGVVSEIFARSRTPLINGTHATLLVRVACDLSIKALEWVYFWSPMVSIGGTIEM